MYIRYPIVLPHVIVAQDINADIRLANMSQRGAFLTRAFSDTNGVKNTAVNQFREKEGSLNGMSR